MKLQIFLVLVVLVCSASAGKRYRRLDPSLPEGECDNVQPFDPDHIYTYGYIAITEHIDPASGQGSDIRLTCTATITVPRRCSGKLRVSDCSIEEGKMAEDGSMKYTVLPSSAAFDREMRVSEMAFHFNRGQITRIFVDRQERTNVTNFKRGMLSNLQAYNPELPKEFDVGDAYQISQINVYGQGIVEHKIVEKVAGLPATVEVVRDSSKIELPWERRQWNFVRMKSHNMHPLLSAFKNYISISNDERWAKSKQTCVYTLVRGRRVQSARCEEKFPLNPIRPNIATYVLKGESLETRIRQEIDLKGFRRMTSDDRSKWDVSRFDEDNVMFEEEWEETNMIYNSGFDAATAFSNLVRNPVNDKTPALISKLSRWMAISSQEEIEKVWAKCESECSAEQKKDGRLLWVELLNSCIINDWCQIPYCPSENSTTCENALESFITKSSGESQEVKTACLTSLQSIYAPSPKIVDATLRLCRSEETPTPHCIRTLGTVVTYSMNTCDDHCENQKSIEKAKEFLQRQLKKDCQTKNPEIERAMAAAAESIGRLGREGRYAAETLLACATNPVAPSSVVVKALVSYGNVTRKNLNEAASQKLIRIFKDKKAKFETRVTCFHVLMKKNLHYAEVDMILATVMDDNDHYPLITHCREDLKAQLSLRGTAFCNIHPDTAWECVSAIVHHNYDIGVSHDVLQKTPEERKIEIARNVTVPYINMTMPCYLTINSVYGNSYQAALPILSQLSLRCLIDKQNITVLDAGMEIAGIGSALGKIFGHNQWYTDIFAQVFGMSVKDPIRRYSTMNKLISEGKYSLLQDIFRASPSFYLKVLGQDISLDSIFSFAKMRQITIGNFWKILDIIEEGFEYEKFVAGQPFLMQHASPTCIGAPMISTIDVSYIIKNKMSLKANLRKMLFYPNEEAIISIMPELHASGIISRNILEQFSPSCGMKLKFNVGHGSGLDCSANTNQHGLNMVCKPKSGKSRVFYISGKRYLSGPSENLPSASVCVDYNLRKLYNLQVCHQPTDQSGFAYEVNIENEADTEFQAEVAWESKQEPRSTAFAKELKVDCTATSRTSQNTKKVLWSSILSIIPSRNEVRYRIDSAWLKWQGATNFMFIRKPESSVINGCFMSANASAVNSIEMSYFNTFQIIPASEKKYIIKGISSDVATMDGSNGYKIIGAMEEVQEGKNTSRKMDLNLVNLENKALPLISYSMLAKKVPTGLEAMPGFETLTSFGGTLLPVYKTVDVEILTYDSEKMYDKIIRMTGLFASEGRYPHFLIHRVKGLWGQRQSKVYETEMYLVANWMHAIYKAQRDADGNTRVQTRTDIPETAISYSEVVSGGSLQYYSVQRYSKPVATFIECNYTDIYVPYFRDSGFEISLAHRMWHSVEQDYKYEKGYAKFVNYKHCFHCHNFEVDHPKISIRSITKRDVYHEEKWLKLHYSLLDYITLSPLGSYYFINNLKNEFAEVGYKAAEDEDVSIALLRNTAACSATHKIDNFINTWRAACTVDAESLPFKWKLNFSLRKPEKIQYTVEIDSDMNYAGVGCVSEGSIRFIDPVTTELYFDAKCGSPKLEHEYTFYTKSLQVHSKININGFYQSTHKSSSETVKYEFTGTSDRIYGGKQDLEIKLLGPNSAQLCALLTVYKGDKWIIFKKLADETKYDYVSISYDDAHQMTMSADFADEIRFGVKSVEFSITSRSRAIAFGMKTPICSMSCGYIKAVGFEASSSFKTSWLTQKMSVNAGFESARYSLYWNNANAGGARISNNMSLNYAILNSTKALDAKIKLGAAPGSFACGIALPDLVFDLEMSRDTERPTQFKYYCDVHAEPNKIIIQRLKLPIIGRDLEMSETALGCEYRDNRLYGVSAKNMRMNLSGACQGLEPTVVQGNIALNRERVFVKLEEPKRSFVANVDVDPSNLAKNHIELVMTLLNNKVDLYWDMKNENKKMMATGKWELSSMCWKTKEMTSIITSFVEYDISETAPTANFPEVKILYRFNHTLRWVEIPYENEISYITKVDGMTTKILFADKFDAMYDEINTTMTGCHMRFQIMPDISVCFPNTMEATWKYYMPSLYGVELYEFNKVRNDWNFKADLDYVAPYLSDKRCRTKLNTVVTGWKCDTGENWCLPKQLHLKNFDLNSTKYANKVSVAFLPFLWPFAPKEYTDVEVKNSEIILSRESADSSDANTNAATVMTTTVYFSPNKLGHTIKMERPGYNIDHFVECSYNPETYGWQYNHRFYGPEYETSAALKASSPLTLTTWDIKWETPNGFVRNFSLFYTPGTPNKIYCSLTLGVGDMTGIGKTVLTWNSATAEWECTDTIKCTWVDMDMKTNGVGWRITKGDYRYKTLGMISEIDMHYGGGNDVYVCKIGNFGIDIRRSKKQWNCNIESGRYPWMNQTFVLKYSGEAVTQWQIEHDSIYSVCTCKFESTPERIDAKELDCRMKYTPAAVKVEYINEEGSHLCRMSFKSKDGSRISCLTTPMVTQSTQARLECKKLEGSKQTKFTSIPVTMHDFPFMGNSLLADKVLFLARSIEFCYKAVSYPEEKLFNEIQQSIKCADEAICRDIAHKVKLMHYAVQKELKIIGGAKSYYLTKPRLGEYAIKNAFSYIPGYLTLLPDIGSRVSVSKHIESFLKSDEISFVHWSFQPYYEMTVGMKLDDKDKFMILTKTKSDKYPWLTGSCTIMSKMLEGHQIVNITSEYLTARTVMLLKVVGTRVQIVAQKICSHGCKKSAMMVYNPERIPDGRSNITSMFMKEGRLEFVCDTFSTSDDWMNTDIACFTDMGRTHAIGKLSFTNLPKPSSYDYLDIDKVIREILNVRSRSDRNKITAGIEYYTKVATDHVYGQYTPFNTYGTAFRAAQYVLASILHEVSGYKTTQQFIEITSRFAKSLLELQPQFSQAYDDISDLLSGVDIPGELGTWIQSVLTPMLDAVGYVLEGRIATSYGMKDGAFVLVTDISSSRLPLSNIKATLRLKRIAWNRMILNITVTQKMVEMNCDCTLVGASFFVDRLRFSVPEIANQYAEARFGSNPHSPELLQIDIIMTDNDKRLYLCRGGQPGHHLPMWHFHCYELEGTTIPENPPTSAMYAHLDIDVGDLSGNPVGTFTRVMRIMIMKARVSFECCMNATRCDKIALELFNMKDIKFRRKMVSIYEKVCSAWKKDMTPASKISQETRNEYESSVVTLTRKYKSHSYDSMISHALTQVRRTKPLMREDYDFTSLSNVVSVVYSLCAPAIHYTVVAAEYIAPTGLVSVSRCTRCLSTSGMSKMMASMKSERLPILNYETVISLSSEGIMNTSVNYGCMWGWLESEINGFQIMPMKGKFGMKNRQDGVDVVFRPEMGISSPAMMSLRFNAGERYSCDALSVSPLSATYQCASIKAGKRGPEAATCMITPMTLYAVTLGTAYKAIRRDAINSIEFEGLVEYTCTVKNRAFKKAVASNLVHDAAFITQYCSDQISNLVKSCGELLSMTQSFVLKAAVDWYNWLRDIIETSKAISVTSLVKTARDGVGAFIGLCHTITVDLYEISKAYSQSGFAINRAIFDLPSYLPILAEFKAIAPQYSHAYYNYMKLLATNVLTGANCVAGMIHDSNFEQAITFNNHLYTLPKTIESCSYLLAGDVKHQKFEIALLKNDIQINVQERSIVIDSKMRVFESGRKNSPPTPVNLPLYTNEIACTREKDSLTCTSLYFSILIISENNVRTAFHIKVAEAHCANTRGMMGVGRNVTEIPRMMMINGKVAPDLETFIDSFCSDRPCPGKKHIIPVPEVSHEYCDPLFENENWMRNSPQRRRSFMKACQQSARSLKDACRYVTEFNRLCHLESTLVTMAPECELCRGKDSIHTTVHKVRVTVVMSLSVKTSTRSLQEVIEAVRTSAKSKGQDYEISFVTFGGRDELFGSAIQVEQNMLCRSTLLPWTLPDVEFNGPVPTFNSLTNTLWYTLENTPRLAEGVGSIYVFVMSEDTDFTSISSSPVGMILRDNNVESYLYVPDICRRAGRKTGATIGFRKLFTSRAIDKCEATPADAAALLAYSHMNESVTCSCEVFNPLTGKTMTRCVTPTL